LSLAILVFIAAQVVFSFRWQILVSGYGLKIPTRKLFNFYLIGLFFNNFLPTGIGGDVFRIYNLIKESGERTFSFASVMVERLMGISSTLFLTLVAILGLYRQFEIWIVLYTAIAILSGIVLFFLLVFNDRFVEWFARIVEPLKFMRLGERALKFINALRVFRENKKIYLKVMFVSVCAQIMIIFMIYLVAQALVIDVSFWYLLFVVPLTFLLTMFPSINGIGFREGGYVILLGKLGVTKAAALSLSLLTVIIPMFVSILGGLLFIFQKRKPKREDLEIVEETI
jgi:uncharacterized protein (TIRG00374 family)